MKTYTLKDISQGNFYGFKNFEDWLENYPKLIIDDGKNIVFTHNDYWIDKERIRNSDDILEWIVHLSEKNWFTMILLRLFVGRCKQHLENIKNKEKLNGN